MDVSTKEFSYMLGFSWADGFLNKSKSLRIECIEEDLVEIENIFMMCGNFKKYIRNRPNRKTQMRLELNDTKFCSTLANYGYNQKSKLSPCQLLTIIPTNLKPYFFRGIVDGDGCFYSHKEQYLYQFSIGSTYDQDWTYMEKLFKELGIKYTICRRLHKKSKSSIIRITNRKDINIFCHYIYGSTFPLAPLDLSKGGSSSGFIGLSRKLRKASMICSMDTGV